MLRRLFAIASALSLLLFTATCVLWVRSYLVSDRWSRIRMTPVSEDHKKRTVHISRERYSIGTRKGILTAERTRLLTLPGDFHLYTSLLTEHPVAGKPTTTTYHWDRQPTGPVVWKKSFAYVNHTFTQSHDGMPAQSMLAMQFPLWFPALITFLPPAASFAWWWRKRKTNPLACPICGYDLRATPDRCPECGTGSP